MKRTKRCSECEGNEIYKTEISAGGGYAPDMLPGAHAWWSSGKLETYVCGTCGYYKFFVPEEFLAKLRQGEKFSRHS